MVSGRISLRYFSFLCMVLFQPGCTVELPEAFEQAASDESPGEGAENAGGESGEDSGAGEVPEDTAVSSEADGTEPVDALTGEKDGSEETDSGSGSDASAGNTACENDADCAGTAVENPCEQVACVSGTCTIGSKPINSPCEGDPLDPCNTYTCSVDGECVPSPRE